MIKYRTVKDVESKKWRIVKLDTWFPIPQIVEECHSRSTAYVLMAKLREQQLAQKAGSATFADPQMIGV